MILFHSLFQFVKRGSRHEPHWGSTKLSKKGRVRERHDCHASSAAMAPLDSPLRTSGAWGTIALAIFAEGLWSRSGNPRSRSPKGSGTSFSCQLRRMCCHSWEPGACHRWRQYCRGSLPSTTCRRKKLLMLRWENKMPILDKPPAQRLLQTSSTIS